MIPYGRQNISEDDIQAVIDVMRSDFLTQGSEVPKFEQAVCDYTGAKYGIAVNSATSALHIACEALGLGEGDWLWTTPITFVASANCGLYCGAKVDFVDIDPATWNLSPKELEKKLKKAKQNHCLPKVVVAVHLCGLSCDMKAFHKLSKEYNFYIIEDASHAIGGKYQNETIGQCKYSDITIFSFHPVKTMTTGEGGMAMTNQELLANKMVLLRSHGIVRDPASMSHVSDGAWYYQQVSLGYNYRMTDLQAALGSSQLLRLDAFVARRHEISDSYDELLFGMPLKRSFVAEGSYSGLHLYVVCLDVQQRKGLSRKYIFDFLRKNKILVNVHYIPIHTQPFYKKMGFRYGDYPESEAYYEEAISLPMFPTLTKKQQKKVCDTLSEVLNK